MNRIARFTCRKCYDSVDRSPGYDRPVKDVWAICQECKRPMTSGYVEDYDDWNIKPRNKRRMIWFDWDVEVGQ